MSLYIPKTSSPGASPGKGNNVEKQHGGKLIKLQEEIERELPRLNEQLEQIGYEATVGGSNAESLIIRVTGPRTSYADKIAFECLQGSTFVEAKAFSKAGSMPLNTIGIDRINPGWLKKALEDGLNVVLQLLGKMLPAPKNE